MATAPAFVAFGSAGSNVGTQSQTVTLPAGLVAGQLLIAVYNASIVTAVIDSAPAGWTVVTIDNQVGTATSKYAIAWTRYSAGMADPTFHLSQTTTGKNQMLLLVYDATSTDPVFTTPVESSSGVLSLDSTITTTVANTRVVNIFGGRSSPASGISTTKSINGGTERANIGNTGGASANIIAADEVVATPGSITRTATFSESTNAFGVSIAVAPVVAATATYPSVVGSTSKQIAIASTATVPLSDITNLQNGDLIIAAMMYCDTTANEALASRSSGWSVGINDHQIGTGSGQIDIIYTTYSGTTTDPTWTMGPLLNASSGYSKAIVGAVAFRNAGTPVFGTGVDRPASDVVTTATSITATVMSLLFSIFSDKVSNQTSVTTSASLTDQVNSVYSGGGGGSLVMSTEQRTTAGATGTRTATYGVASGTAYGILINIPNAGGTSAGTGQPPVVSLGADIVGAEPYAGIPLSSSVSGGTGTYSTYAWTIEAGGGTLTGSGATRTYFPTGTIGVHDATIGLVVTDSAGMANTKVTQKISVLPVTERAAIGGQLVPLKEIQISTA